jgi:hypothetical protein
MNELTAFVDGYDGTQQARITFAWNGKHAKEFQDANLELRRLVIENALPRLDVVPLALVRDLFTAETQFAQEAWGVNTCVSALAQALLIRGGASELEVYGAAIGRGMDAGLASKNIQLPPTLSLSLAQTCLERLNDPAFADRKNLYSSLRGFFEFKAK